MLNNKNILLGVTASIAAYKTANLVRLLKKKGANVKVIQTPKSLDFITPLTLSTLSENPVYSEMVNEDYKTWNNHVDLGSWADIMLIAPASAKTLSKMSNGDCDNLLLASYLSANCPVYFAPAMDLDMYKHSSTKKNINNLVKSSNILIPPSLGELASGLYGEGRMEEPENIISFLEKDLLNKSPLHGKKILITAGPTLEKIDRVRYISNFSTGKMGVSLARVGAELGAEVILIKGPTNANINHINIKQIDVVSADEMLEATLNNLPTDIAIFSAAVSDFKVKNKEKEKIKKDKISELSLEKNTDILGHISNHNSLRPKLVVGFAAETNSLKNNSLKKLSEKNCDWIIANDVSDPSIGFGSDYNEVSIFYKNMKYEKLPKMKKSILADNIVKKVISHLN